MKKMAYFGRLDEDLKEKVRAQAKQEERSLSQMLRILLKEGLEKRSKK